MTVTLQHAVPAQLLAGDSIEFLQSIPGDLVGWTGSARLTGGSPAAPGSMDATTVVTENRDLHITFSGQSTPGTRTLAAGNYTLTVWMRNVNDRYTIAEYRLTIRADASTGTPALTHAARMLDLCETALANRLGANSDGGIEEYEIHGRRVKKISTEELTRLRNKYAAEVQRLQNPGAPYGRVKAVFSAAGDMPHVLRRYGP